MSEAERETREGRRVGKAMKKDEMMEDRKKRLENLLMGKMIEVWFSNYSKLVGESALVFHYAYMSGWSDSDKARAVVKKKGEKR